MGLEKTKQRIMHLMVRNPNYAFSFAYLKLRFNLSQHTLDDIVTAFNRDGVATMKIRSDDNTKALYPYVKFIEASK